MASISCENCGFKGAALPSGVCPRCGAAPRGETFRVPPLPAPSGAVASDIEPDRHAPPGGYLDLDLGEAGKGAETAAVAAPRERRRTGRTGPAFAAIAPKEIPGSPRSVIPIFIAVGVGCLALILAGVLVSRGGDKAPAPAQAAAPPPAPAQPSAPAPAATPPAEGSPAAASPTVLAAPSAPAPEPAAQIVPDPRAEHRTERGRRSAPAQPVRLARPSRPEREASRAEPAAAPAPQTAPVQAAAPPPPTVAPPAAPAQIEDAPRYPAEGFRRPQMTEPQCVQNAIRAPRDLADRVSGPVTIRFAVGPEGEVSLFQIMGDTPDPRLPAILENAVRSCTFTPAADAQGKPIRMWMTMPIRFAR